MARSDYPVHMAAKAETTAQIGKKHESFSQSAPV